MNELGAQILLTSVYDLCMKVFEEDARQLNRFPEDYREFSERSIRFFDNPTTAHSRYNESLRKFLEARGYGLRFHRLQELIHSAIKQENDECNLALHHLGKLEAKQKLSKENYERLVKTN